MKGNVKDILSRPRHWDHFFWSETFSHLSTMHTVDSASPIDLDRSMLTLPVATLRFIAIISIPGDIEKHVRGSVDQSPICGLIACCFVWTCEGA